MVRILILLLTTFFSISIGVAPTMMNDNGDNIVGHYEGWHGKEHFKTKIVKLTDGTYRCHITWSEFIMDKNGKKRLDTKNPDKRLRQKALDEIVIFSGLRYDKAAKEWNGARIYDPRSGWSFKMNAKFMDDGRLRINGSVMGISEKVYWKKIK